jgi:hypothetical protein
MLSNPLFLALVIFVATCIAMFCFENYPEAVKTSLRYLSPFIVIASAWIAYQYWLPWLYQHLDTPISEHNAANLTSLGTFGDSFGALNTLFSGMAFAGIVLSLFFQSKQIQNAKADVARQHFQQEKLAFEGAFFQLLNLSNEIVRGFHYSAISGSVRSYEGKSCLKAMKFDFVNVYLTDEAYGETFGKRYENYYFSRAHEELGHYFRNLYQIVKYVHYSSMGDKKFYTNILRAQLSSNALFLLYYNGISSLGYAKFLPLLAEYAFFEHLPLKYEVMPQTIKAYGEKAFGTAWEKWEQYATTGRLP